jgi:hypothetical protein
VNEKAGLETLSPAFPIPCTGLVSLPGRPGDGHALGRPHDARNQGLWLAKLSEPLRDDISMQETRLRTLAHKRENGAGES